MAVAVLGPVMRRATQPQLAVGYRGRVEDALGAARPGVAVPATHWRPTLQTPGLELDQGPVVVTSPLPLLDR